MFLDIAYTTTDNMYNSALKILPTALFCLLVFLCMFFIPGQAQAKTIYIGDSRMTGMYDAVNGTANQPDLEAETDDVYWRAKNGAGYRWLKTTGIPYIENNVEPGDDIVIMMGVNDCPSNPSDKTTYTASDYAKALSSKAKIWRNIGANTYFVLPTPVDSSLALENGYWHEDASVCSFDKELLEKVPDDIECVDLYDVIADTAIPSEVDGVHYGHDAYIAIRNAIADYMAADHAQELSNGFNGPLMNEYTRFLEFGSNTTFTANVMPPHVHGSMIATKKDLSSFLYGIARNWNVSDVASYRPGKRDEAMDESGKCRGVCWLKHAGIDRLKMGSKVDAPATRSELVVSMLQLVSKSTDERPWTAGIAKQYLAGESFWQQSVMGQLNPQAMSVRNGTWPVTYGELDALAHFLIESN